MADRDNRSGGKKKDQLTLKVVLPPCRMSFPHFFKPAETDGGDRYQANFLFPPDTDFSKFRDALNEVMTDFFGAKDDWPRGRNDRLPADVIRDADEKEYEGYKKGWYFIKAASRDPVGIVDAQRNPVTNEREIYGGRWCRISVSVRAYDNKSRGVGVYLNSVQVLDHAEQFGGRGPARNDFEDWDGDPLSNDERGTGVGTDVRRDDKDERDERRSRPGSEVSGDPTHDRGREQDRGRSDRGRDDDRRDDGRGGRGREDRRDDERSRSSDRRDREDDGRRGRDREDDRQDAGRDARSGRDDRGYRGADRHAGDDALERGERGRQGSRGDREDADTGRGRDSRPDRSRDERDPPRGRGREDREDDRGSERRRDDDDNRPSRSRDRDDDRERDRGWN